MAVKIRLLRMGKIRNPQYRIVVADSRTKRDGRAIEYVGIYQPKEEPSLIQVKSERVQYWLSVGAQPSEAVQRILEKTGDWQQFKGLPAPPPLLVKAPKVSRTETYEAEAKAAAGVETPAKSTPKKATRTDAKAADTKGTDAKAADAKGTDAKSTDTPAADTKDVDTTVNDITAADRPAETAAAGADTTAADAPADTRQAAGPEVAEARPTQSKPIDPAEPNREAVAETAGDPAGAGADAS